MEKKRLGRGLEALLSSDGSETASLAVHGPVAVDQIDRNPYQPRQTIDPDDLAALAESIRQHGLLQPLVVRAAGDRYQLVAGERRLRAALEAGLTTVPVHVVDLNDQQAFEATLVENLQRTDLNPIEKAHGFADYLRQFGLTHEQLAAKLGLDRSTVTNLVRLLELAPAVQNAVRVGQISGGHARALLAVSDPQRQVALCQEVIAKGLSVRATEALVQQHKAEPPPTEPRREPTNHKTAHIQAVEDELRQKLATRVEIRLRGKESGQFILSFASNDDFERILEVLRR